MVSVGGFYKQSIVKGILEKMKIRHELDFVYITSDGRRFLNKKDAIKHEESIQPKDIVTQCLDRLKGDNNEQQE